LPADDITVNGGGPAASAAGNIVQARATV